jgi:hypothetical protein
MEFIQELMGIIIWGGGKLGRQDERRSVDGLCRRKVCESSGEEW